MEINKIKEIQKQVGEILKDVNDDDKNISIIIEHEKVLNLDNLINWVVRKIKNK